MDLKDVGSHIIDSSRHLSVLKWDMQNSMLVVIMLSWSQHGSEVDQKVP
jgi:hypothetical protein